MRIKKIVATALTLLVTIASLSHCLPRNHSFSFIFPLSQFFFLHRRKKSQEFKQSTPRKKSTVPPPYADDIALAIRKLNNGKTNCDSYPSAPLDIMTNEITGDVPSFLKRAQKVTNRCHIGFSCWHNFDIIALRQSDYGVLCDFNPAVKTFIDRTLNLLATAKTRDEFFEKIYPFTQNTRFFLDLNHPPKEDENHKEWAYRALTRENSWFATDEGFLYIRSLALQGKMVAITEDIRNPETFIKIAEIFREKGFNIDTLYLSNVEDYIREEEKGAFKRTVHSLIQPNTLVIEAKRRFEALFQTVHQGSQKLD